MGAIGHRKEKAPSMKEERSILWVRLEWPTEITETEVFKKVSTLPRAKEHAFVVAGEEPIRLSVGSQTSR